MRTKTYKPIPYPIVGQWHFIFALAPDWMTRGTSIFQLGLFKLVSLPPEGEMIQKKNYKGFWIRWRVELPSFGWGYNFKNQNQLYVGVQEIIRNGKVKLSVFKKDKDGAMHWEETKPPKI